MTQTELPLGTYLFYRLSQVTKTVFGVPGDFNLNLLEHIYNFNEAEIKWCGNCNELNAGYAADGYSRLNQFGCFITTFGVGELSALNAVAGSFAENAPVLHIVGTSSTSAKTNSTFNHIHHLIPSKKTYEASDHGVYERLVEPFSIRTEILSGKSLGKIQEQIDSLIEDIVCHMKPGYLFIPSDLPDIIIPVDLTKSLDFDFCRILQVNEKNTKFVVDNTLRKLYGAKNPAIIVDQFMKFDGKEVNEFLRKTKFYCYSTNSSRGIVDETLPNFHGVFNGRISTEGTLQIFDENDFVLYLGANINETNFFGGESSILKDKDCILVGKDYAQLGFGGDLMYDVNCHVFFKQLICGVDFSLLPQIRIRTQTARYNADYGVLKEDSHLSQKSFSTIVSSFIKDNDVIINEMCSFMFEMPNIRYKKNCSFVGQPFYGSIGYGIPATLGASLAIKDLKMQGRAILFQGDGSAQMTLQEFASFIRFEIDPVVFLLNNDGYGVERVIKGPNRTYNNIAVKWDWTNLLSVFGDFDHSKSFSLKATTAGELMEALASGIDFKDGKVKILEVILGRMDVPDRFKKIAGVAEKENNT